MLTLKNNSIISSYNIIRNKIKKVILIFKLSLRNKIKIIIKYILDIFYNKRSLIIIFFIFKLNASKFNYYN